MPAPQRAIAALAVAVAAAALVVAAGAAGTGAASVSPAAGSAPGPSASAARVCSVRGRERTLGATYVTSIRAYGVRCSTAYDLVRDYHRCRRRRGGADGRCPRVDGYRCSERRVSGPTQYDARATCTRGSRRVVQTYTQNT